MYVLYKRTAVDITFLGKQKYAFGGQKCNLIKFTFRRNLEDTCK